MARDKPTRPGGILAGLPKPPSSTAAAVPIVRGPLDHLLPQLSPEEQTQRLDELGRLAERNYQQLKKDAKIGRGQRESGKLGGSLNKGRTLKRDIAMWREYEDLRSRRPDLLPTAAAVIIGKKHKVRKSAAIEAIRRGREANKKASGEGS